MRVWLKILIIATIILGISSFVWFLAGSTAYFQRGMDIIGTAVLCFEGIPALLLVGLFTILLLKGWMPSDRGGYVGISVGLLLSIFISASLIQSVSTNGWAKEKIDSDALKITADGKYEYRIDLINLFQRNSYARLYLKDVGTGKEMYIPTEIQSQKINGIAVGKDIHWVKLEPTDNASLYILSTTKELPLPEEKFTIDIRAGTSSRLK